MNQKLPVKVVGETIDLGSVRDEDIPHIVSGQIDIISRLDKKISSSLEKAESAREAADTAKNKEMGWVRGKRDAIEALQCSGYKLSEAICSNTEALKLAFEALTKLAESTKYLFALGVSSIALNRMVVRELEAQLKGASAKKLSELAQREVLNVVTQLKAQEDILSKQERLVKKVRTHDEQLLIQVEKDIQHDELLHGQTEKDKQHDELLKRQIEQDMLHSGQLQYQTEKDRQHDMELLTLTNRYKGLETAFESLQETQKALQECVGRNSQLIEKQELSLKQLTSDIASATSSFDKKTRAPLVIAIIALLGISILFALRCY